MDHVMNTFGVNDRVADEGLRMEQFHLKKHSKKHCSSLDHIGNLEIRPGALSSAVLSLTSYVTLDSS